MGLLFEDLDFVAVGVGDEGHFALAAGEFFTPTGGPDFDAVFFELVAVGDDVGDADGGVHEIFGELDFVVGGMSELKEVVVAGQIHEGKLVAFRRGLLFAGFEAELVVKGDGGVGIGDADAGV